MNGKATLILIGTLGLGLGASCGKQGTPAGAGGSQAGGASGSGQGGSVGSGGGQGTGGVGTGGSKTSSGSGGVLGSGGGGKGGATGTGGKTATSDAGAPDASTKKDARPDVAVDLPVSGPDASLGTDAACVPDYKCKPVSPNTGDIERERVREYVTLTPAPLPTERGSHRFVSRIDVPVVLFRLPG